MVSYSSNPCRFNLKLCADAASLHQLARLHQLPCCPAISIPSVCRQHIQPQWGPPNLPLAAPLHRPSPPPPSPLQLLTPSKVEHFSNSRGEEEGLDGCGAGKEKPGGQSEGRKRRRQQGEWRGCGQMDNVTAEGGGGEGRGVASVKK